MQDIVSMVEGYLRALDWEPPAPKECYERGEDTREQQIAWRVRAIEKTRGHIEDAVEAHRSERQWWAENKNSASINELRRAVRSKMAQASVEIPQGEEVRDAPERWEERSLRWLLHVRSEIARRRMVCGQALVIMKEAQLPGRGEQGLAELKILGRGDDYDYDEYLRQKNMGEAEFRAFVEHREQVARSYGTTGDYLIPGWLDEQKILRSYPA